MNKCQQKTGHHQLTLMERITPVNVNYNYVASEHVNHQTPFLDIDDESDFSQDYPH
jgi:hypothetical protein